MQNIYSLLDFDLNFAEQKQFPATFTHQDEVVQHIPLMAEVGRQLTILVNRLIIKIFD